MKIKIYGTGNCHFCKVAKEYFEEKELEHEYIDVINTEGARDEMLIHSKGQLNVPVIVVGKTVLMGFDKARLDKLIK